ncbi:MAG: TetR/AcrR family transcriptional regulator [Deltaproteobacteria bacterium]|nr:TetR/AcrR family transcriptional regulator [Deltaproteobacteria bacterium]MBW1954653.1 TetR/AcrR family transcriptional regulator [Deltaproteobacteria bacterium]MBW2040505.1 TetR/AcrR family transcriptional regulator [Deltaproteobacteria bacterium]MBW2131373.1 TetR/AcrR family transcriptional regulator [Deltaproteobacteria bacterium]
MCPVVVDRNAKREQIAQAALNAFSKKGYAATSVREIAAVARVGKGTLYEYFRTKADIFLAAVKCWLDQFETRFFSRLEGIDDPAQKLAALALAFVELVDPLDPMDARMSVEVIQQGILEGGVLFHRPHEIREMMAGSQKMVEQILLDGISKGMFTPETARHVGKIAVNLLGYLDGILLHAVVTKRDFDLEDHVAFYINTLIHSISGPSAG